MKRSVTIACVLGAVLGAEPQGRADSVDLAAANALFYDGKRLTVEGRTAEACARFKSSMAVAPQLGVQLNLAVCYERLGRTASAWVAFGEAAALARTLHDPREALARRRVAALSPRLSRIAITVAPGLAPSVTRDGVRVASDAFGVAVPVDPGSHTIAASARDRVPWSARVDVSRAGEVVTVAVPALAPVPTLGRRRPTRATWIAGGLGIGGLGLGTYFGLSARALWHRAAPGCDETLSCGARSFDDATRSRRYAAASTTAFVIGGAAAATGLILYLRSPRRLHVVPTAGDAGIGVIVGGGF